VPIFPLPGAFLFPHQVMPLHVFEPRYRQLVEDLLDGPGRLVIGTQLATQPDGSGTPDLLDVAGLGEILRHQRLADGRFQILVLGLARVHFTEVPSDRLYRQVRCRPFVEIEAAGTEATELVRRLRDATAARLKQPLPLPDTAPPSLLADLLLQTLQAPRAVVERAYVEPSVSRRARLVLQAAERASPAAGEADTE
jgi:Lon protease-like protein